MAYTLHDKMLKRKNMIVAKWYIPWRITVLQLTKINAIPTQRDFCLKMVSTYKRPQSFLVI